MNKCCFVYLFKSSYTSWFSFVPEKRFSFHWNEKKRKRLFETFLNVKLCFKHISEQVSYSYTFVLIEYNVSYNTNILFYGNDSLKLLLSTGRYEYSSLERDLKLWRRRTYQWCIEICVHNYLILCTLNKTCLVTVKRTTKQGNGL